MKNEDNYHIHPDAQVYAMLILFIILLLSGLIIYVLVGAIK